LKNSFKEFYANPNQQNAVCGVMIFFFSFNLYRNYLF